MNLNEIATKADIQEILVEIQKLKLPTNRKTVEQEFLRSSDVRRMLNISSSTLQRLRISGSLKAKKVHGTWFYKLENINNIMEVKK